jgi:hypothetical protein
VHVANEVKSLFVSDLPLLLVVDETIDFDLISLRLNLSSINLSGTVHFHVETQDPMNSAAVSAARVVLSLSLLPSLLRQI